MTFPLGGDFVQAVSRDFNFVSSDPKKDQGDGFLQASPPPTSLTFLAGLSSGSLKPYPIFSFSSSVEFGHEIYRFSNAYSSPIKLAGLSSSVVLSTFVVGLASSKFSFWRMAQFFPGILPHLPNTYSDLYDLDIVSRFTFYDSLAIFSIDSIAPRIHQVGKIDIFGNIVQSDYYTNIVDSDEICVGDEEPPVITYVEPTISGAHVRPRNQTVEFLLTDTVAGVDISTVSIGIDSTTTSGSITIVDSGTDLTGGDVAIIGDASSYRFRYVPPFLWDFNDIVTVTISGADLAPQVDGNPFFCGANEVNYFIGDIPFQVLNQEDLNASLTAVGDISPPYISFTSPASGTLGNNVFSSISLKIADDLTGVSLDSIDVSIAGEQVVSGGLPTSSETSVAGSPPEYQITYNPSTAFTYGSTIMVVVVAEDNVNIGPPNQLSTSYEISFIDDSTLIIENFQPAIGTHVNVDSLDIKVDVRDDTYGVDSDQTFLVINNTIVSGTKTTITSGIRMVYHPPNDFDFGEPIRVTVHGTNDNLNAPAVREEFYDLFYGCRILYFNNEPFTHADNVNVFVRARNKELFHKDLSTGYFFSTYTQPSANLSAGINAINPTSDITADITGLGPEHRYGETVTVEFSVEDLEGRLFGPYMFTYTIENEF